MKIYHWINKYNHKVSLKIIKKYSLAQAMGKSQAFCLHPSLWLKYLLRLFLVLSSTILFHKEAYQTFFKIISSRYSAFASADKQHFFYIKIKDLIATLFGYRYLVREHLLPLLPENNILKNLIHFEITDKPLVSIIIPIYNHLDYTFNCLKSIQNHVSSKYSFEIIIIDDCSSDGTEHFFKNNVSGLNYIRNTENSGFIKSCNTGAEHAKAELICFLNNDVQVCENWLESLVETLKDNTIGCVGSKLIYANGILQEAGGIVYNDASAANFGRYEEPDHPSYNYMRNVDYCSGASLMFRRHEFKLLGYFNKVFVPAYYEDTDICFQVMHKLKKKVVYQPLSSLIHFEGISSGTDIDNDSIKNYQRINKSKFLKIWQKELDLYPVPGDQNTALSKNLPDKTIMIIDDQIPTPDKDSGSVRLCQIIKIINALGYHIIFVPNDGEKRGKYFDKLVSLSVETLYRFPNRKAMLKIAKERVVNVDFIWICKLHNNLPFEFLFDQNPNAKRIFDTIDLHFLRMHREALLTNNTLLLKQAAQIKEKEINWAKRAQITIAITTEEKQILQNEGVEHITVIPNIHEEAFLEQEFKGFNERKDLVFIGGYAHKPNIDAALWLVSEIMPIIWAVNPSIKLWLLGSQPTEEVMNLKSDQVFVPGYIEDVSTYFNNSRIFVAPLRYGAGMKGKIGQSLSYALPVITTAIGAEGIGLIPETDYLLATTAEDFAKQILRLYDTEILWKRFSDASKLLIKQYHPDHVKETIRTFLPELSS